MEKSFYLGFVTLELSNFLMYETYYDKLQKYFGINGIQLHYQDTDAFVISVKTSDVSDSIKLQVKYKMFDFSILNKDHKLFPNEFKNLPGYLKIETPKSISMDKFVCLRSKCYAYKTNLHGDDNKLKGICKGYKNEISFELYHNCPKISYL